MLGRHPQQCAGRLSLSERGGERRGGCTLEKKWDEQGGDGVTLMRERMEIGNRKNRWDEGMAFLSTV